MADIKTRDITRGTIKTIDRASSSMNHLKEETIRSKALEPGSRAENGSAGSYAQNTAEHYMRDSTAYVARTGTDLMIRKRERGDSSEQTWHAFREYGAKTILGRREKARMEGDEVLRNAESDRLLGQIRKAVEERNETVFLRSTGIAARNVRKPPKGEELLYHRNKEFAIKRITEQNAKGAALWRRLTNRIVSRPDKAVRRSAGILKGSAKGLGTLLNTASSGGAVVLSIVVIMVFFGSALMMNEDGSYLEGSGDATIVEVAKGELGNAGGDKFWKWYGFKNHVDWCAIFVSWCADQCGYIESGIIPRFAVVGDGANWFKARHRWAGRGYKPKPGDIIFFDYEQDGLLDHVGIVESCDGKIVTTIEGNSSDACRRQSYGAGNSQIAGYGLTLIPGGGSKAQRIARKAVQLAYPDAPDEAKYRGGKPTAAYAAALQRAYPNRSGWGKPSRDGASCDVFVGVCLVDSGVDKDFPRGYRDQAARLAKRTDLYECVVSTTSRDIKESELKDGDICTWEKSSGTVHIWIYAGGKARHAAHDKWYGRTTSVGNNLKINGKTVIRIYRVKD